MSEGSYSFSLTTFSPSGKLLQIEHALKAVSHGQGALGIQGVCLISFEIISVLLTNSISSGWCCYCNGEEDAVRAGG